MRSASANTAVMSCSTSSMGNRPLSRASSAIKRSVSSRPTPATGSSSSSSFGSIASAIASSSARFSPWERVPAGTCARSASPTSVSAASAGAFSAASRAARPNRRKLDPVRACTASATFSSAEMPGMIEVIWNERASPSVARTSQGSAVMSRPAKTIEPASGLSRPEIWLISVVLPAPFGPITACSSPGMMSRLRSSVTTSPPKLLCSLARRSNGSATSQPPRQFAADADETAAREQHDQYQDGTEDHLPMLGEAREPLLGQEVCGRADDRAMQRAQPAEQHHHDQFTRALPGHVGGADEFGGIGKEKAGEPTQHAGNHIGRELETEDVEADRRHADGILPYPAHYASEPRHDDGAAKQIAAEQAGERHVVEAVLVLEQGETADRAACGDGQAVVAAIRRERAGDEERHLPERQRDHDEIDAAGTQADDAGQEREQRGDGER